MQTHFFATKNDLVPILKEIDLKNDLIYVLMGHFDTQVLKIYSRSLDILNLGFASNESAVNCNSYLILNKEDKIGIRDIHLNSGEVKFAVDQLINPRTITFNHGGQFSEGILLYGAIGTVSNDPISKKIFGIFRRKIVKTFKKIKAFYVGSEAFERLLLGWRLTIAVQSPQVFDLSLK